MATYCHVSISFLRKTALSFSGVFSSDTDQNMICFYLVFVYFMYIYICYIFINKCRHWVNSKVYVRVCCHDIVLLSVHDCVRSVYIILHSNMTWCPNPYTQTIMPSETNSGSKRWCAQVLMKCRFITIIQLEHVYT